MRRTGAGAACGGVLLVALALAGCQWSGDSDAASQRPTLTGTAGGHGAVFLGADDCGSRGRERVTEVPCDSERAAARVIARYDGRVGDGPACPARTDYVLHISESRPSVDEDGDGEVSRGYACMRNLEPPHPGDPGGGGGPRTVVGDCVYGAGRGEVRETACDGSGPRTPEYRVVAAVPTRSSCAPGTALYVSLGGPRPVGCAVRV
ncbi:hypothetical protein [Streptomyces sp. NRRL B-1347]|uniref:hypothetical protein n=1 Tax=Streptomyces sp. NRRL B-1347 TaxID=1476877 RepID=UPI0004C7DBC5|nr:hypothetical protein [Streptomyces sp. NRRL B-1347]